MSAVKVDLTHVVAMILCVNGGATDFAGTLHIKDFKVGDGAQLQAGIEGIDDLSYYHDTGKHALRLFGLTHVSALSFSGADKLLRNVQFSAIKNGRATMEFECIPGATGDASATITAKGDDKFADNSVTFPVKLEPNYPPTISTPEPLTAQVGKPQVVKLAVDDGNETAEQPLTFTVTSSGAAVDAKDVKVDWSTGSEVAYVRFTPRQTGECNLDITVDDNGGGNSTAKTTLAVKAVKNWNNPPTLAPIADQSVFVGEPKQSIILTGLSDGDGTNQSLKFSASSSDESVIPTPTIEPGNGSAAMSVSPTDKPGVATITVTVTDDGGTADNNGNQSIQRRFTLTNRVRPLFGYTESFSNEQSLKALRVEANIATSIVNEDGTPAMKIACTNKDTYGGIWINLPVLDLTKYPVVSLEVKPETRIQFDPVLYDGMEHRNNSGRSKTNLPAGEWTTITLDLSKQGSLETDKGVPLDAQWISKLLLNFHPSLSWPFTHYTGNLYVRNLRFGKDAAGGMAQPKPLCTIDPAPEAVLFRNAGKQSIRLSGIGSGSSVKPTVAMQLGGDTAIGDLNNPAVDADGAATLTFTVGPTVGRAEVTATVTADGSEPVTRKFTIDVINDDRAQASVVQINCEKKFQTIRGFGTFYGDVPVDTFANDLCGSAVRIGSMGDILNRPDTSDINVVNRKAYNLKAIDFDRVRKLREAGVETFILTSWSPPAWMKPNHSVSDQQGGFANSDTGVVNKLDDDYYDDFAKLMVGLVRTFKDESGVDLYAIGLQNEPCFMEPYSCGILDPQHVCKLMKIVGKRFEKEGIKTRLMYSEHMFNMMDEYIDALNNDPEAQKYCDVVALHGYDSKGIKGVKLEFNLWTKTWTRVQSQGVHKELWMTETEVPAGSWASAMDFAANLYGSLEYGNIGLWTSWSIDGSMVSRGKPTANLWVERQFSNYFRPGAVRVASDSNDRDLLVTSYINDETHGGKLASVLINKGTTPKTVDLRVTGRQVAGWQVTSSDAIRHSVDGGDVNGNNLLILPPDSVTTVVGK